MTQRKERIETYIDYNSKAIKKAFINIFLKVKRKSHTEKKSTDSFNYAKQAIKLKRGTYHHPSRQKCTYLWRQIKMDTTLQTL